MNHNVHVIKIDTSGVNTEIIPDNGENVYVKARGIGKVSIIKHNGEITIMKKHDWFVWLSPFKKKELTIHISERYDQNVDIGMGFGNLTFHGDHLKLNKFSLKMGSGNIFINGLTSKTSFFNVDSGNIDMKHYEEKIKAKISSGIFIMQVDKLTSDIDIQVSSGNAVLSLPNHADFTLNGKINSGGIIPNITLDHVIQNQHQLRGTHGSGTHFIDIKIASGNIMIK